MKQYSAASVIAEVIFYTVAIPAAYSDDYNREASWNMWSEMLHSEECTKSAHFNLCTVLIMISLNFDCTNYIQCLGNAVSDLDESDDSLLNPRKQIIQAVCGKGFSLGTLPVSLQVGLFCVLISLIPCLPSELFEIAIESTLSIMRSDTKLFYDLINSCKEKILRRYIRILLHCGYSINNSKSAQFLVKEFLVSSSDHDTLARKCNTVLQDSSQMILAEEQCYFLKPLCNAFGEIHSEISADESSTLGLCAKEVLQLIYRLISPFDYKSPTKLTIFELSLPVLSVFLQRNDSTAEKNENIIQHMKIADRLCKVVCKHPDRLTEFVVPEHLPQLLRSSIMWMVKRGKLENIISWKYVKNFKLYDRSTVNYIITVASVEMLRNLLHSTSFNLHVLEKFSLYSALAEHKSEDKKKLLSTVLKDILEVVAVMAETDHLIAIDFLRHIFPIAAGSPYERDFISFALTVLAVNCGSLVEDCVALRSALSLILDCLRFGPNSVINDQCSVYASLFICVGRAIEKHVNDVSPISPHLIRHLSYGCAKVANEMVKYERSFSRLAPFIISEYLEEAKCLSLALFRIFSMCDRHSIALLTTNLPPLRKTRFINLTKMVAPMDFGGLVQEINKQNNRFFSTPKCGS
uniref:Uncharacterized protein n=1 Tax=Setaria digitata TaxID=48799 RepID=A0A915PCZ1_9BILA